MIVTKSRMGMSVFAGTIASSLAYLFSELGIGSIGARPEGLAIFFVLFTTFCYFVMFKTE